MTNYMTNYMTDKIKTIIKQIATLTTAQPESISSSGIIP